MSTQHCIVQSARKSFSAVGKAVPALDGVDLEIARGEYVSITGHSGSGKTTLLSLIGGILAPSAGKVVFDGTDLYALPMAELARYRAEKVGFVFQFPSLLSSLNVMDNLLVPALFRPDRLKRREALQAAARHLEQLGLLHKASAFPAQLSGGEARRIALTRALMNEPEILLADEPTGDLDEQAEQDVIDLLERFNREKGMTLLLVTHDQALADRAQRRVRMSRGRLAG